MDHVKKKMNDGRRSRKTRAFDLYGFKIVILICFSCSKKIYLFLFNY